MKLVMFLHLISHWTLFLCNYAKTSKKRSPASLKSHLYSKRSEFECYLKSVFRCRDCSNLETKHIVESAGIGEHL